MTRPTDEQLAQIRARDSEYENRGEFNNAAYQQYVNLAMRDRRALLAEVDALRKKATAWRDLALHLDWCADCAEYRAACCDNGGMELYEAAYRFELPSESKGSNT